MSEFSTFVGLDVHGKTLVAALFEPSTGQVADATFAMDAEGIKRLHKWVTKRAAGAVRCCYEAGCLGFDLQRRLEALGLVCCVVAPTLVLQRSGHQRRKNDRRDARRLAEQLAFDQLTEVYPPSAAQEAVRALVRCREDERLVLHAARQRLLKFLAQWGVRWRQKNWTRQHEAWLRRVRLPEPQAQVVLEHYLLAVEQAQMRLADLDQRIEALAQDEPYREPVARLRCLRGFDTLAAMIVVVELFDFSRFTDARGLMGFVGLIPGEHSSGESQRPRGITKAGNALVRRVLIQAAWHYKQKPQVSKTLSRRQLGQPAELVALAERAWRRLWRRYWHLERKKGSKVAVTAVARELTGFVWAVLSQAEVTAQAA